MPVNFVNMPAGPLIAFVRNGDLWVVREDGTGERQVTRLGSAAEPAWSPDRRSLAFSAALDPDFNLLARNVFSVRHDGKDLRQVTPLPRAGVFLEDAPKAPVRGRAVVLDQASRRPATGLRVTAWATRASATSGGDGTFQIYAPAGVGWIRVAGTVDGRRVSAWKAAPVRPGEPLDLGDFVLAPGDGDAAGAPSWTADGRRLAYQFRRSLVDRFEMAGPVSLRTIHADGSLDAALHTPTRAAVVAGPVVRGPVAWFKTSDGRVHRIDLDTKRVSETFDAGIAAPDALAVSPDGTAVATLRLGAAGAVEILLSKGGAVESLSCDPPPRALDYSPDGRRLVVERGGALWILDPASSSWTRLADGSDPVWHGR
jgi:hypothetical protein